MTRTQRNICKIFTVLTAALTAVLFGLFFTEPIKASAYLNKWQTYGSSSFNYNGSPTGVSASYRIVKNASIAVEDGKITFRAELTQITLKSNTSLDLDFFVNNYSDYSMCITCSPVASGGIWTITHSWPYNTSSIWDRDFNVDFGFIYTPSGGSQIVARPIIGWANMRINTTAPTGTWNNATSMGNNTYMSGATLPSFTWSDAGENEPARSAKLNNQSYTKGSSINLSDGTHSMILSTVAGKSTTYTLIVDKTAPSLSYPTTPTRSSFTVQATDSTSGVDRLFYRKGTSGNFSSTTDSYFTVSATSGNNGTWYFYAVDSAGNQSATVSSTLDTVAPSNPSLAQYTGQEIRYAPTDSTAGIDRIYYRFGSSGSYSSTTATSYTVSASTGNNGTWYFYAVDRAGNQSATVSSTLDTVAPSNPSLAQYTNQNITFAPTDATSGISRIYYRFGSSGSYSSTTASSYTVSASTEANYGIWYFYAEDRVGNASAAISATIGRTSSFGNKAVIFNSYKVTSWYRVNLPARVFGIAGRDIAGSYTFESYASALSFATAKETEYRVSTITGGWLYITATNENIAQMYTDRDMLDATINKYAKGYISEEQRLSSTSSNNYYTTVNAAGDIDPEALTRNTINKPVFLSSYASYDFYLCRDTFSFTKHKPSWATSIPSYVNLTYLANDVQLAAQQQFTVPFDTSLKNSLMPLGGYKQGYYLVREYDAAGNEELYIIYIDIEAPKLQVGVTYGNGSKDSLLFDSNYVAERAGTLYYLSFSLVELFDNIDTSFLCVLLSGKGYNKTFLKGESFPTIDSELGSGKWTITIYDRSLNLLSFEIIIAGTPPTLTHTSLSNEVKLTITVHSGDANNVIVSLELYKILSDGTYIKYEIDDDGTPVNFTCLSYVLRYGGKYTVRVVDLFGRTTEMTPIFYTKGLPTGTLSGVSNGGRTNKDVTFKYSGGNTLIVYAYINNIKTVFSDYYSSYSNNTNTYTVTFLANGETSYEYLLFLAKEDDNGLFIEYTFEIDCIIGQITIVNIAGEIIEWDASTNKSFELSWDSDLTIRYYTSSTPGGELGMVLYKRGTKLETDALYYFVCRDDVGNEVRFTILLKTKIRYTIVGDYITQQGKIVSNNKLVITVLDIYSFFEVTSNNGYAFVNGNPIAYDGIYTLSVVDNYGNSLVLIIEINTRPPAYELIGVEADGICRNNVTVNFDGDSAKGYLTTSRGVIISSINSSTEFAEHGTYYIRIVDYIGNVSTLSFLIDLKVDFESSVRSGEIHVGKVEFSFLEPVENLSITLNGEAIEGSDSFSSVGWYVIAAIDAIGNKLVFEFMILPARAVSLEIDLPEGIEIIGTRLYDDSYTVIQSEDGKILLTESGIYTIILYHTVLRYDFTLVLDIDNTPPEVEIIKNGNGVSVVAPSKPNLTATLVKDGQMVNYTLGRQITGAGKYVLTVIDDLGNTSVYTFEIDFKLNTAGVAVAVLGGVVAVVLIIIVARSRRKIRVK